MDINAYLFLGGCLSVIRLYLAWRIVGSLGFNPRSFLQKGTPLSHRRLGSSAKGPMGTAAWGKRRLWVFTISSIWGLDSMLFDPRYSRLLALSCIFCFSFSSLASLNAYQTQPVTSPDPIHMIPPLSLP